MHLTSTLHETDNFGKEMIVRFEFAGLFWLNDHLKLKSSASTTLDFLLGFPIPVASSSYN